MVDLSILLLHAHFDRIAWGTSCQWGAAQIGAGAGKRSPQDPRVQIAHRRSESKGSRSLLNRQFSIDNPPY